jgi:hypothetical protein
MNVRLQRGHWISPIVTSGRPWVAATRLRPHKIHAREQRELGLARNLTNTGRYLDQLLVNYARSYVELRKDPITRQSMADSMDSPAKLNDRMMPKV